MQTFYCAVKTSKRYPQPNEVECDVFAEFVKMDDEGTTELLCRKCASRFIRYGHSIQVLIRIKTSLEGEEHDLQNQG